MKITFNKCDHSLHFLATVHDPYGPRKGVTRSGCTFRYREFDLFEKMGNAEAEMDAKLTNL
jgi:hypothetical protein